jgi:hypothetical protein
MAEDFEVIKNSAEQQEENKEQPEESEEKQEQGGKVIDEANYKIRGPREKGPTAVGRGGDPLFRRISATKEQLLELMEETSTVQDWVQRETCNNVALSCLENEELKEVYFAIKDGFGEYGKISLMGYKTPLGVEIPRLKIYDSNGDVIEVLTGPFAIDELNKRAIAYKNTINGYEEVPFEGNAPVEEGVIAEYSGNPDDYTI